MAYISNKTGTIRAKIWDTIPGGLRLDFPDHNDDRIMGILDYFEGCIALFWKHEADGSEKFIVTDEGEEYDNPLSIRWSGDSLDDLMDWLKNLAGFEFVILVNGHGCEIAENLKDALAFANAEVAKGIWDIVIIDQQGTHVLDTLGYGNPE